MRKLLVAMMVLGLAAPAVAAEDTPKEDPAIKQIDEMIAKADVNKDDAQWRTKLTKPEPATFDASRSYYANMNTNGVLELFDLALLPAASSDRRGYLLANKFECHL